MYKKLSVLLVLLASLYLTGCASVPMASGEKDTQMKAFSVPAEGKGGMYIYRNSRIGGALKKSVYIDDQLIGETAAMTYFYRDVEPGKRKVSTESEFSNNDLLVDIKGGVNHFVRQYIKLGLVVGGANLEVVSEEEGRKGVLESKLAK